MRYVIGTACADDVDKSCVQPAVVVGVDGSAAALRAALWAVDEAVSRGIPLRLVHALDGEGLGPQHAARKLATAENAIRHVAAAVEATNKPVKVKVDITQGSTTGTLLHVSCQAAMVCVGAVGSNHFRLGRSGSTAAAVAASAKCPVAVVRGRNHRTGPRRWIFVVADGSPDDGIVLETAVKEAKLRDAALRVISCRQPRHADTQSVVEGDRRIRAELIRRLARWRRRYPDLQAEVAAVHCSISSYLAAHAAEAQMVVIGARDSGRVHEIVGPAGNAALGDSDCVVLVVDHQHL